MKIWLVREGWKHHSSNLGVLKNNSHGFGWNRPKEVKNGGFGCETDHQRNSDTAMKGA